MSAPCRFVFVSLCLLVLLELSSSTRIKGSYTHNLQGNDFIHYLNKFGVSKGSTVYVYGNATSSNTTTSGIFAFVNSSTWNQVDDNKSDCSKLLKVLDCTNYCTIPPSSTCSCLSNGEDFVKIDDLPKTEFLYLLFVFCTSNDHCNNDKTRCQTALGTTFNYEFYIVNDDPTIGHHNPFTYQFPYNENGFLITYLTFALLYMILVPVHFGFHMKYTIKCQTPLLIILFNFALVFEAFNIMCGLIHYSVYSHNGYGVMPFYYFKGLLNLIGDWFLILVLILIAGGWMVTIRTVKWKIASFLSIGVYIFLSIVYYICSVVYPEVHPWDTRHPLQNWAGGLYLAGRSLLLFYVWYQIYHIHRQEEKLQKLRLYRVLFVIFTAWFWYLPIVVAIVSLINPVVAWVVLINFMNVMNFLVNVIMTALFCPIWSHEYFQFDHILNSMSSSVLLSSFGFSKQYTKIGDTDPHVL